ncbi:MAG: TraB/GumN family protein [Bacteroidota bacterium]
MKQLFLIIFSVQFTFSIAQIEEFPFKESSLLWKIEGDGIKKGCYLFGTSHLIEKEYFIFPDKLKKIVAKSENLMMELPGVPDQREAMKYILLPEGTFSDFFSTAQMDSIYQWAELNLHLNKTAFDASMSKMKPFVVIQLATQMHFMGKTESYELSLIEIAKKNEISINGLETVEQQMSLFDELTKEQQAEMVMEGIRNPTQSVAMLKKMEEIYAAQNIDGLYTYINEEQGVLQEEQARFLDERNKNWIPKIKETCEGRSTFIAVGAGHLGGPNGVIRLLQKEGYTLTPVKL